MKLSRFIIVVVLTFLALSPTAAAVVGQRDKEVQAIAEPILDTVLTGLYENEYALFSQYFDDAMKKAIPEKKFSEVRNDILKRLGKNRNRSYQGFLNKNEVTVVIWMWHFKGVTDPALIRLELSKMEDKLQITGFSVTPIFYDGRAR